MDFWKRWNRKMPGWAIGVTVGLCLLVFGAYKEQFADIYRKAIMICLECIGIG